MCTLTTTTTKAKKKKRTLHKLTCINRTQKHYPLICCCCSLQPSPAPNINGEKPVRKTQHFSVTSVVLSCRARCRLCLHLAVNQPTNQLKVLLNKLNLKQTDVEKRNYLEYVQLEMSLLFIPPFTFPLWELQTCSYCCVSIETAMCYGGRSSPLAAKSDRKANNLPSITNRQTDGLLLFFNQIQLL